MFRCFIFAFFAVSRLFAAHDVRAQKLANQNTFARGITLRAPGDPPKATDKPVLQCTDVSISYCSSQVRRRDESYCTGFGRIECCMMCNTLKPPAASAAGKTPNPPECRDYNAPDFTSYTAWCKANVLRKQDTDLFSCYGPALVQNRCMKTCDLCEKPASSKRALPLHHRMLHDDTEVVNPMVKQESREINGKIFSRKDDNRSQMTRDGQGPEENQEHWNDQTDQTNSQESEEDNGDATWDEQDTEWNSQEAGDSYENQYGQEDDISGYEYQVDPWRFGDQADSQILLETSSHENPYELVDPDSGESEERWIYEDEIGRGSESSSQEYSDSQEDDVSLEIRLRPIRWRNNRRGNY